MGRSGLRLSTLVLLKLGEDPAGRVFTCCDLVRSAEGSPRACGHEGGQLISRVRVVAELGYSEVLVVGERDVEGAMHLAAARTDRRAKLHTTTDVHGKSPPEISLQIALHTPCKGATSSGQHVEYLDF
jgi:hypothetical protein